MSESAFIQSEPGIENDDYVSLSSFSQTCRIVATKTFENTTGHVFRRSSFHFRTEIGPWKGVNLKGQVKRSSLKFDGEVSLAYNLR